MVQIIFPPLAEPCTTHSQGQVTIYSESDRADKLIMFHAMEQITGDA